MSSTRRRRSLALFILIIALCVTVAAAHAKKKKAAKPAFLKAFNKSHQTLLVGMGILPHLRAALTSPVMQSGVGLVNAYMNEEFDAARITNELNTHASKFPSELALGLDDRGVANIGRSLNTVILALLANTSVEKKDTTHLSSIHDELTKLIKKGGFEGLVLFANLSSEEMAKGIFGMVHKEASKTPEPQPGVTFKVSEDVVSLTIDVAKLAPPAQLTAMLVDLSIVPDAGHPATSSLVGALQKVTQEIWFERIGSGLKLGFGERPRRSRGLKTKKLGPAFRAESGDIFWARMQTKPWAKIFKNYDTLMERYKDTPIMLELAKDGLLSPDSMMLASTMESIRRGELGKANHTRIWREEGALKSVTYNEGVNKGEVLAKSALKGLIPGSSTLVQANSLRSLETELSAFTELLSVALKAAALEEGAKRKGLGEELSKFVEEEAGGVLAEGAAALLAWGGDIDRLRIVHVAADGTQERLEGARLPHYGMALMMGLERGADGLAFGGKMLEVTSKSLCAMVGGTLAKGARFSAQKKLGLGAPTLVVPWTAMSACKVSDSALQVDISGDLLLHAFQMEDVLIVSTSRSLSARIAATHAGAHTPYTLPKPPKGMKGKLVGFQHASGNSIASWIDSLRITIERLSLDGESISDAGGGVISEGPDAGSPIPDGPMTTALKLSAEVMRLVDRVDTIATLKGRLLTTLITVKFHGK